MSISNQYSPTPVLEKTTITIASPDSGPITAQPLLVGVQAGDVVEWLANREFMLDFGGPYGSPVSYGQFQFVSTPAGTGHRIAIVAKKTPSRRFDYTIRTSTGQLDPAIIIDPNFRRVVASTD